MSTIRRASLSVVAMGLLVVFGCAAPRVVKCTSPEDNPQHHYLRGMEALEEGKLSVAQEKFDRALYCDERYGPASGGLAIVGAEKTKTQADAAFKKAGAERALEHLKRAKRLIESEADQFDYEVATIRVHAALKGKDWLEKAVEAFTRAKQLTVDERRLYYYQGKEALDYFMGVAYLEALEFQASRDRFAGVLNAKREGKWHGKADKAWKRVDKIVRAMAGITVGDVGKRIAVKDAVTRGDLVALLIDELKIDKLFAGRIPATSTVEGMKPEFTPADILSHQFKQEVLTILKWRVRGLEPKYDETTRAYLFRPEQRVSREEMAFILEDVLIKLTADEKIATAYFGHTQSPFPDVKPTSPSYNAIMNITTRGIMEGALSGEFRVNEPVDGAEALLAIRVFRQSMNIY